MQAYVDEPKFATFSSPLMARFVNVRFANVTTLLAVFVTPLDENSAVNVTVWSLSVAFLFNTFPSASMAAYCREESDHVGDTVVVAPSLHVAVQTKAVEAPD